MLLVWLQLAAGSVYNVTPDDHYYPNTTCHHCHNLQHYLLNTTKYFTSNTQLLFLPGLHHLHTDLIIQNVHNISLIGSTTNGTTPDTVIQCNSSGGIVMTNITNLIVTNITVRGCLGNEYNNVTVLIKQCTNVQLRHVVIEESHNSYGIVGINILGHSFFSYISNNVLEIIYNDTTVNTENQSFSIDHYHINCVSSVFQYRVILNFCQQQSVKFQILNSTFQNLKHTTAIFANTKETSNFLFKHCRFLNNSVTVVVIKATDIYANAVSQTGTAHFYNCDFENNKRECGLDGLVAIEYALFGPVVLIDNCTFQHNNYPMLLQKKPSAYGLWTRIRVNITVYNTKFSSNIGCKHQSLISLSDAMLNLKGNVAFHRINNSHSVIKLRKSILVCFSHIEFVMIKGIAILEHRHIEHTIFVYKYATISIRQSNFTNFFLAPPEAAMDQYPPCYFQYLSNTRLDNEYQNFHISIVFENNIYYESYEYAFKGVPLSHCKWLQQSAFNASMPLEVNNKFIKYINSSGVFDMPQTLVPKKKLCSCSENTTHDCYTNFLHPIFAGETMEVSIYIDALEIRGFPNFDTLITAIQNVNEALPTACVVANTTEMIQIAKSKSCYKLTYTITFPKHNWCELFLKGSRDGVDNVDVYYIKELPCPAGFIKINRTCQCHQILHKFNIMCDINDQTIIRPPYAWILPILNNHSYNSFYLSLHCPFHYCLPYSSHLNFSTPNSQCQFSRSGILCGQCQQGLSTVFGSSHCQQCSNIYLFLIVPIAIAGLVLVLLLFILNLTVTDGTINAFILYVNIISINTSVFFPRLNKFTPAYTFLSLANLDLGIQTCFYNGMDDYAKMWLQLAFPFYLIFIATSLIVACRYSTTIQRLTARRALPVLATLFLLSYTKILSTVSYALFSYSTITHIPKEHTTIVWSIDANVTLSDGKLITFFIVCICILLIQLFLTTVLLFSRLQHFKLINKFKPLLDAFRGPFKDNHCYWAGSQLCIRAVFFSISSINEDINLAVGLILLAVILALQGYFNPYKKAINNISELLYILNLQVMYIFSLYGHDNTNKIVINIMVTLAALHFTLIIIHHIIMHGCNSKMKNMILSKYNFIEKWTHKKFNKVSDMRSSMQSKNFDFDSEESLLKIFE